MANKDLHMGSLVHDLNIFAPAPCPAQIPVPAPAPVPNPVFPGPIPDNVNAPQWIMLFQNMLNHMANQAPAPHTVQNMIKFSDLPRFMGKSRDVDAYVKNIQSQIDNASDIFPNNSLKVSFFGLWLGPGVPEKWFHGVCESQPELMNDYTAFVQAFTNHFGNPDSVETAHRQLASLRQTGSALTYIARFREIVVYSCLSEYSMHTQFVDGLK